MQAAPGQITELLRAAAGSHYTEQACFETPWIPQLAAAIRNAELHLVLPVAKTEKRCICDPGFGAAFCTTYQIGLV